MKYQDRKHLINEKIRESENQKIMNELREKIKVSIDKLINLSRQTGLYPKSEGLKINVEEERWNLLELIQSQPINKVVTDNTKVNANALERIKELEKENERLEKKNVDKRKKLISIKEENDKLKSLIKTKDESSERNYHNYKKYSALYLKSKNQITQLQKKIEWISVKDRLPEDQEPVLLCGDMKPYFDNWYEIGYYFEPDKEFYKCSSNGEEKLSNVTHWKNIIELNDESLTNKTDEQ